MICTLLIATALIVSALFFHTQLKSSYNIKDLTIIEISKGDTDKKIFNKIADLGLIKYPYMHLTTFKILKKIRPKYYFQSGEYNITSDDNYYSLINKLVKGSVYYRRFTVTEGQTTHEVITALENNPFFSGKINNIPKEGEILPETYFFRKGTNRAKQLDIMKKNMELVLEEAWNLRSPDIPLKNKYELLILASIVEKETGQAAERDRIAGVFMNRIRLRMKLQSDPTVIYTITNGKYKLERPLSKRDLQKKSSFNTYTIPALPIAPISNPGKEAIFATSRPMNTKELYFVANGNGGHRFSKTLREHNKNVQKLRAYERQQKAK